MSRGYYSGEPYKGEILPYWHFRTPAIATESSEKIYQLFLEYLEKEEFVGADMARKFLQMGFTRARRYCNYKGGRKYDFIESGYRKADIINSAFLSRKFLIRKNQELGLLK